MSVSEIVVGKTIEELIEIQNAAQSEIENAKSREIASFEELIEEVKAKAELLGLNPKSFFNKELPPKYRNPDGDETWNGRGPSPAWMKALLANVPKEQWKEERKKYLIED